MGSDEQWTARKLEHRTKCIRVMKKREPVEFYNKNKAFNFVCSVYPCQRYYRSIRSNIAIGLHYMCWYAYIRMCVCVRALTLFGYFHFISFVLLHRYVCALCALNICLISFFVVFRYFFLSLVIVNGYYYIVSVGRSVDVFVLVKYTKQFQENSNIACKKSNWVLWTERNRERTRIMEVKYRGTNNEF